MKVHRDTFIYASTFRKISSYLRLSWEWPCSRPAWQTWRRAWCRAGPPSCRPPEPSTTLSTLSKSTSISIIYFTYADLGNIMRIFPFVKWLYMTGAPNSLPDPLLEKFQQPNRARILTIPACTNLCKELITPDIIKSKQAKKKRVFWFKDEIKQIGDTKESHSNSAWKQTFTFKPAN